MKKDIHPEYRPVVFQDLSSDFMVLTRSTIETRYTIKWKDGKEYPLAKIEISSASHPFFTGVKRASAADGRVQKFNKKYNRTSK